MTQTTTIQTQNKSNHMHTYNPTTNKHKPHQATQHNFNTIDIYITPTTHTQQTVNITTTHTQHIQHINNTTTTHITKQTTHIKT